MTSALRRPAAFLALWNGIADTALQPEYETWHTFEHVPERVGLPGFIEARRYRSWSNENEDAASAPSYFTCYWLEDLSALDSAAYREVFAVPTPWSARMRTQLRAFFRQPCRLAGSHGTSSASQLCTLRLRGEPEALSRTLAALVAQARIVSAQWGTSAASAFEIPISNASNVADTGAEVVALLQGIDRTALAAAAQTVAALGSLAAPPAFFEWLSLVRQQDLAHPLDQRQPALTPLFQSFQSGDTP